MTASSLQHHVHTHTPSNISANNSASGISGKNGHSGDALGASPALVNTAPPHCALPNPLGPVSSPSPEPVPPPSSSASVGNGPVPNPFAVSPSPPSATTSNSAMTTTSSAANQMNWTKTATATIPSPTSSTGLSVPNPFQPTKNAVTATPPAASAVPSSTPRPNGVMIASSGIRVAPPPNKFTRHGNQHHYAHPAPSAASAPNTLNGHRYNSNPSPQAAAAASPAPNDLEGSNSNNNNVAAGAGANGNGGAGVSSTPGQNQRRQKRLERNRESARLSRRRRKQYLEVLEERVNNLSFEMDKGRRDHVMQAVSTLQDKRNEVLSSLNASNAPLLENGLSRANNELRLANTFQTLQLFSLSLPPQTKFLLWLTLQNDSYFRGGRAASERLSAARIGERMLTTGNDRVSPAHGMWPLLCNEVGLSYDQEEKVRAFQRTLLQDHQSWLQRHTAAASGQLAWGAHDCMQSLTGAIDTRQRNALGTLDAAQKLKFITWAAQNKERILNWAKARNAEAAATAGTAGGRDEDGFSISNEQHEAANLYILSNRLQRVLANLPKSSSLVPPQKMKKLSRRPLFESLGNALAQDKKEEAGMTRASSSGSLKRSVSELSVASGGGSADDDKAQSQISPEEAAKAADVTVDTFLGFVRSIIPKPAPVAPLADQKSTFTMPPPPPGKAAVAARVTRPVSTPSPVLSTYENDPLENTIPGPEIPQPTPVYSTPVPPTAIPTPIPTPQVHPTHAQHPVHPQHPSPQTLHHPTQPTYIQVHVHPQIHPGVVSAPSAPPPQSAPPQPAPAVSVVYAPVPAAAVPLAPVPQAPPVAGHHAPPPPPSAVHPASHPPIPAFLPPHLNVVPEEGYLPGNGGVDFLFDLKEEDWAIGEDFGDQMDTT